VGAADARGGTWNAQAARFLLAIAMIAFGAEHFIDAGSIAAAGRAKAARQRLDRRRADPTEISNLARAAPQLL
jgi:hypothetical protein